MSKPISFGFGKPKGSSTPAPSSTKTSISLPTKASSLKPTNKASGFKASSVLRSTEDEDQDDEEPKHEELTGFGASGAILSKPAEEKKALVIENAGNLDWRRKARGKNLLPKEVQDARGGQDVIMVEKNEVATASGLQFAETSTTATSGAPASVEAEREIEQPKSADEEALQALLDDGENASKGTAVIEAKADIKFGSKDDEERELQELIQSYPESSTLEEYAAMPVEEFGMAMLRGMGKKRRANGEVINLELDKDKKEVKKRKQEGFLGIGAKPAPGMDTVEIGAWGKADMRKNNKGAGFFTPLMVRDGKTGETITEEELERRKKKAKGGDRDGWKERRDRNLERSGRGRDRDDDYNRRSNGSSRHRDDDGGDVSSRSPTHMSRSRDQRRRDDDDSYESGSRRGRDRDRDFDRDRDYRRDRHRDRDHDDDRRRRDRR